jgi:maltose alpha-D-glucosyltransferase/alpha-amylase
VVIDFEGDRGRSLSDRRRKHSPFRDVATMIRSFHYAAVLSLKKGNVRHEDIPALEPWGRFWYLWVSTAFLKAYLGPASQGNFLPRSPREQGVLLDHYGFKRAFFELREELNCPSDKVAIPLRWILHLLEMTGRSPG